MSEPRVEILSEDLDISSIRSRGISMCSGIRSSSWKVAKLRIRSGVASCKEISELHL